MGEYYTAKGCEKFDVAIRFAEKLLLKDYLEGLMPEISELLRNGETDDETTLSDECVNELLDTFGEMQRFIDQNLWDEQERPLH